MNKEISVGIEYKNNDRCTVNEVVEVFVASGIRRPVDESERIFRMDRECRCNHYSKRWQKTSKDYQGQGIGKRLVEILKTLLGEEEIQYVLTSAPGATSFYEKIGFERADKAFVIKRKRNW